MRPSVTSSAKPTDRLSVASGQVPRPSGIATDSQAEVSGRNPNRKRIMLTGCNSLVGHQLFQQMRNDDVMIKLGGKDKPHEFLGTLVKRDEGVVPNPSDQAISILDMLKKPKTFTKGVLTSDIIIVDLMSGTDPAEAETIIKILRQSLQDTPGSKKQTLILISSVLVWNSTIQAQNVASTTKFTDADFQKRVPTPKFQYLKNLENLALTAPKINSKLKVHVVCSGLPFGNGESNDVFYEFFRRAWLSTHPELAALPIIGEGQNSMPTIHVNDLARCVRHLAETDKVQKQYLMAVDKCKTCTQFDIMKAISSSLGNGEIKKVTLSNVINEDWAELMSLDLKVSVSDELGSLADWHCPDGITTETMPKLNQEFNYFRGLFPLKVFFCGPPFVGKSHYAGRMASAYGIPHLKISDMIQEAQQLNDDFGAELRDGIDKLKEDELEKYNANKKKKDPDLTKEDMKPRLSNELLVKIVKNKISSPACMNKGFILDGYPKNTEDAKSVFLNQDPNCIQEEGEDPKSPKSSDGPFPGMINNDMIMPQYVITLEAEDALLAARDKEIPQDNRGSNQAGTRVAERIKIYRAANGTAADEHHIMGFFQKVIGEQACKLVQVQGSNPEEIPDELAGMQQLCEQNGKPCCINLITEADNKFLASLEDKNQKPQTADAQSRPSTHQQQKAEGESQAQQDENMSAEDQARLASAGDPSLISAGQSGLWIEDDVDIRIREEDEEKARLEKEASDKAHKEEKLAKERAQKEAINKSKLEKIKEQERDLLDTRSQPIRQYLMDNVVPHLTEGLIEVCKRTPEDAIDYLANFLLERADTLDEQLLKQREEELRAKEELKRRM